MCSVYTQNQCVPQPSGGRLRFSGFLEGILSENRFRNTERIEKQHIIAWRIVAALRHERHQCAPQFSRNAVSSPANNVIMLAEHHVGTVLFNSSSCHNRCGVTTLDGATHLNPWSCQPSRPYRASARSEFFATKPCSGRPQRVPRTHRSATTNRRRGVLLPIITAARGHS